jgi:hypothetical protein
MRRCTTISASRSPSLAVLTKRLHNLARPNARIRSTRCRVFKPAARCSNSNARPRRCAQLFAALEIEPDNLQFLIFTACVLASDENSQGRNGKKPVILRIKPAGSTQPVIPGTLAMTLAELNRYAEAQKFNGQPSNWLRKAIVVRIWTSCNSG